MRGNHELPAARGLTLLRIMVGAVMVLAGGSKMAGQWLFGVLPIPTVSVTWQHEFPGRLSQWLIDHPSGVPAAIIRDLILPNGALFAGALAWLQVIAGVLLVLGLFTRFAAVVAGALVGALAMVAVTSGAGGARFYLLIGVVALALLIGDAGQTWGLDGWRRERRRQRG